ncbi:MAG: YggS family pyridoxal phosphate-dependent enzyme [Ruminococcaceae bacterium]|nr:YggS family pyridoxal phosphate-dependent enzyme [Oscillospiraceae bacterium]
MNVEENVKRIRERIANAAVRAGRNPEDIILVAVTKTVDAAAARKVMEAGVTTLGENRVQSFLDKYEVLHDEPAWHLIGHLQTNKVKYITGKVSLIHSVDSLHLAEEISKRASLLEVTQDILLQCNISGEDSKSGVAPEKAEALLAAVSSLPALRVCGLMTMAPLGAAESETRRYFAGLRMLSQRLLEKHYPNAPLTQLSMGMSGDFEAAIAEGATLIRVGTALFT